MILIYLILAILITGTPADHPHTTPQNGFNKGDEARKPVVTLYHEVFGKGENAKFQEWHISLKLPTAVNELKEFEVSWKWNRNEWKQPLYLEPGQSFKSEQTMVPFDKSDTIKDVRLSCEEKEIIAIIKIIK